MSSPGNRSVANDPQVRRTLDGALQRDRLGANLEIDAKGMLAVTKARAVKPLAAREDVSALPGTSIAQIDSAAMLATAVLKIQELVNQVNALTLKVRQLTEESNSARKAAEAHSANLVDALTRAGLMEK